MSQQSPILVPDSDDDVSVASAGAVEARRLQEQFDAEARRARGDDEATQRLVARLAAPAVDDERSLRLARSLAAPPSEDASLRLARRLHALLLGHAGDPALVPPATRAAWRASAAGAAGSAGGQQPFTFCSVFKWES